MTITEKQKDAVRRYVVPRLALTKCAVERGFENSDLEEEDPNWGKWNN